MFTHLPYEGLAPSFKSSNHFHFQMGLAPSSSVLPRKVPEFLTNTLLINLLSVSLTF